jgi:hypothetical protein
LFNLVLYYKIGGQMPNFAKSLVRVLLPVSVILCANPLVVIAQSNQQLYTPTSVVTGQCAGQASKPGCVLPTLFGSNGLTLFNNPQFPHFAHFSGSAVTTLNQTLGSAIATQLVILPLISPSSGFTFKYDPDSDTYTPTSTSFGPVYAERAETIGRHKVAFGVDYQRFRFSNIDGVDLRNIPAVFAHIKNTGPGGVPEPYESDVISSANSISLNMDQTTVYGTVGLTNRIDISIALPIVSVRMNANSYDQIIRVSGNSIPLGPGININPHEFDANGAQSKIYSHGGSAAGAGDATFRVKGNVLQTDSWRAALGLDVRAPTGDAYSFTGSGAWGIKPFVAISKPSLAGMQRVSPHANVGYEWNGSSILAGNITGTTYGENSAGQATFATGPSVKSHLPGFLFYTFGADIGATRRLTFAFDYLGQLVFGAPRVFQTTFVTADLKGQFPDATGSLTLPDISGGKDNVGLNNGSAGIKYNIYGNLLLTANILFRLDNKGLRQDVTPLVGLSYAFGK